MTETPSQPQARPLQARPLMEGLFTEAGPGGEARIIASRCPECGESFFPPREICVACSHRGLEPSELGPQGRLVTYTIQRNPGNVPGFEDYAVGQVDFGPVRVQGPLDVASFDEIAIDMPVETYIRAVGQSEDGAAQLSYAFRPRR